jgi:hypothetical protein
LEDEEGFEGKDENENELDESVSNTSEEFEEFLKGK